MTASGTSVDGDVTTFASPRGLTESCIAIAHAPGGVYSDEDAAAEASLCSIDFYSGNYALCPKTFSTSPGTIVYDLSNGKYAGDAAAFERARCTSSHIVRDDVAGEPVSYKMTMNGADTSATFAPAALLYYHFSRFLQTEVHVPVSVYRSMDVEEHYQRVVQTAEASLPQGSASRMNRAGWRILAAGARDPSSYRPTSELYTDGGRQIFGIMLRQDGRRYDAEINGTRRSGWGAGQNRDFQETAPYLALRVDGPLDEAIEQGVATARRDSDLRKAMPTDPSAVQVAFWMRELTEIALLDFIFSQQDRVGNIDYVSYWYWTEDGEARRQRATSRSVPAELADRDAVLVRRSVINDNDAGGRIPYANFAKTTGMLEKLRHLSPVTYERLAHLANDLEAKGPLYQWLASSFTLSDRQVRQVVDNTRAAHRILQDACRQGRLRFDLDPVELLTDGKVDEQDIDCDAR